MIAEQLISKYPAIDFHTHLGLWEARGLPPGEDRLSTYIGDERVIENVSAMLRAGLRAGWTNITSDVPIIKLGAPGNRSRDFEPGEAWSEYKRLIGNLHELLELMPAEIVETPADLDRVAAKGKLGLFLSTEGGHMIEQDLSRLETMRADGVTKFQPIHFAHCILGDAQTDPVTYGGMSDLGKTAVKAAHELGMVIDCAHATLAATRDIAEVTGAPIVISHGLMRFGDGESGNSRWLSREHVQLVAETGGMIGTSAAIATL